MLHLTIDLQSFSNIYIVFWFMAFYHNFGYYGSKMVATKLDLSAQ